MNNSTELLCIGNAIVDVFAAADPAWLDRQGITAPVQHIGYGEARRLLGELDGHGDVVFSSGGTAANVAKIAAMLNADATFVGCVGSDASASNDASASSDAGDGAPVGGDALAAVFEKELRSAGVVPLLARGREGTGLCFAFACGEAVQRTAAVPRTAETRIAASPGAALELTGDDVPEDLIAGAEAVVLDGYTLDRRPLVQQILYLASRHGIPIALDVASVFQIREKTEEILHYSRNYPLIVFMNADESIVFYDTIRKGAARLDINSERDKEMLILREICPVLKCITEGEIFPIIVIKLGGRGVVVLAGGTIYHEETFTIVPQNTVGAGDAFCAAFLTAWIRGKPIRECAALGNKVARKILEVPGTRINAEKLKPFVKLLRK